MADSVKVFAQLAACGEMADVMMYVRHCEYLLRRQNEQVLALACTDHTRNASFYIVQAIAALGDLLAERGIDPV